MAAKKKSLARAGAGFGAKNLTFSFIATAYERQCTQMKEKIIRVYPRSSAVQKNSRFST